MKAIGFQRALPATDPAALELIETALPAPGPRDLRVAVNAVSMNPVDTKVRVNGAPANGHRILGYDAAGIVDAVGSEVTLFRPGDEVFYAGDIGRPGTNAEYHLVDERIVARKPESLTLAQAAALPLTAITAWEILFDSFRLPEGGGSGESLLIIGGAGGVGSIMNQLAKRLTDLTVVATASRPETRAWVERMGADAVIDHRQPLAEQLELLDLLDLQPKYVAALTRSDQHFEAIAELVAPRGQIAMIDDPGPLDMGKLKTKSLSFHWEFMFTRPMYGAADMAEQHRLLTRVAEMVDAGALVTTMTQDLGPMTVETLLAAHRDQESGARIGKAVLHAIA